MDIEFENEYETDERRSRRIRWFALGAACIVILIGLVLILTKDSWAYGSSARGVPDSRTFVFHLGNLDGNVTQSGKIVIQTRPDWAPIGVNRFHDLVLSDFFTGCRFFRVLPNFMAQFGINGDPDIESEWRGKRIQDDPVQASNTRGIVTFATAGNNTRTTQLFINLVDNSRLDSDGFAPIGIVIDGMEFVDQINSEWRQQPDQKKLIAEGNDYLDSNYPGLSYIISAQSVLN